MKKCTMAAVVLAGFWMAIGADTAQAQVGCGGGWGGWGINYPYGLYGRRVNEVPYFAMFPPVYYSHPVPRAYGWSPFAYPPGTMTPELEPSGPQEIINPHVPQPNATKSTATSDKMTSAQPAAPSGPIPQVVVNPYVVAATVAAKPSESK